MWGPQAIASKSEAADRYLAGSAEPLVGPTGPTFGRWIPTVSVVVAQSIFVENFIFVCFEKFIRRISSKFKNPKCKYEIQICDDAKIQIVESKYADTYQFTCWRRSRLFRSDVQDRTSFQFSSWIFHLTPEVMERASSAFPSTPSLISVRKMASSEPAALTSWPVQVILPTSSNNGS